MKKIILGTSLYGCLSLMTPVFAATSPTTGDAVQPVTSPTTGDAVQPANTPEGKTPSPSEEYFLSHMSGVLSFTTDYVWRGVSQTAHEPAVQGGLTYTFDSKIYLNLWGSNVNFLTNRANVAPLETDTAIGYSSDFKEITYDIHFVRYTYPRASESDYNELIGSASYKFITALIGYTPNVYDTHESGTYSNLGFNFNLPQRWVYFSGVSFSGGIGYYDLNKRAGNSYLDYNLQIQKKIVDKYTIAFQWTNTNHRNPPYDGSVFLAMITASF